jgi:hypothetical protein
MSAPDDLSGLRWHTGATLRPVAPGESCPMLFRDVGPAALAQFLRGKLPRLAGPLSPLVYVRTAEFVEPYTDHEKTGRLILLRPAELGVWHSGVRHVYVARAKPGVDFTAVGFVPGELVLTDVVRCASGVVNACELREVLGGRRHDEAVAESLHQLERLGAELERTERLADPLRKALQSPDRDTRGRIRAMMTEVGLTESDLCTAWHHLSRERRGHIEDSLRQVGVAELERVMPCSR